MRTFLKFIVLVVIGLYGLNYLFSGESRKIEKSEKLKTLVTEDVFKKKKKIGKAKAQRKYPE